VSQLDSPFYGQRAAVARSSAMAWSGLKLFLCVDTYLPTAFAMSARHDALPRMSEVLQFGGRELSSSFSWAILSVLTALVCSFCRIPLATC
jgi:hypothetical protein